MDLSRRSGDLSRQNGASWFSIIIRTDDKQRSHTYICEIPIVINFNTIRTLTIFNGSVCIKINIRRLSESSASRNIDSESVRNRKACIFL